MAQGKVRAEPVEVVETRTIDLVVQVDRVLVGVVEGVKEETGRN